MGREPTRRVEGLDTVIAARPQLMFCSSDRPRSLANSTALPWVPQIGPQVALAHPDRVEHANVRQLADLAQAVDGREVYPQPSRHTDREVRTDGGRSAGSTPLGLDH